MAAKKKPGTSVANIQEQIKKQAAAMSETVSQGGGNKINVKGRQFDVGGQKTPGPIFLVIVDHIRRNQWFGGVPYVEGVISPPVCIAQSEPASLGGKIDNMIPVDASPDKQAESCSTCPFDKFDSASTGSGKGKECNNRQILAVLSPEEDPAEGEMRTLEVSPTALVGYGTYVQKLATAQQLPLSVVTEVSFDPSVTYPKLLFRAVEPNPNLAAHYARLSEAQALLSRLPDLTAGDEAAQPSKRATKPRAKKKASARRSA